MWDVSDRFLAAIRSGSQKTSCVVDVLDNGVPVEGYSNLPVVGGSVSRDRTAFHLAQCSVTVAAPDLAPLTALSVLAPTGREIRVSIGPTFDDGTSERVPVFTGGIQQATVNAVDLSTDISAIDRSKRVSDAKLEADATYAPGHVPGVAALELISNALSPIALSYDIESVTTPVGGRVIYAVGDDPLAVATDIFKAVGAWVYFNGEGVLIGKPEPDTTTATPVFTLDEGDTGVLVDAFLTWDREPAANWVRVIGTNTEFDVTYTGTAKDGNPASPSFHDGRFGKKPLPVYHSVHVTSTATAVAAAKALLRAKQGMPQSLALTAAPNYALEPGDVVLATSDRLGLDLPVVIDSISLDLAPGAMSIGVRARQEQEPEEV